MGISSQEVDVVECDACGKIQYGPHSYAIIGVSGTLGVTLANGGNFSVDLSDSPEVSR